MFLTAYALILPLHLICPSQSPNADKETICCHRIIDQKHWRGESLISGESQFERMQRKIILDQKKIEPWMMLLN